MAEEKQPAVKMAYGLIWLKCCFTHSKKEQIWHEEVIKNKTIRKKSKI